MPMPYPWIDPLDDPGITCEPAYNAPPNIMSVRPNMNIAVCTAKYMLHIGAITFEVRLCALASVMVNAPNTEIIISSLIAVNIVLLTEIPLKNFILTLSVVFNIYEYITYKYFLCFIDCNRRMRFRYIYKLFIA